MKKIIALLLVLVLVLGMFAGCSPADKNDSGSTGSTGEGTGGEGNGEGGSETLAIPSTRFGILLENPIKLISLIVGSEPTGEVPDIKNVALDLMADMEGGKSVVTLGADMFGKNYGLNLYANDKSVVINAPGLYDKAYGATYKDLMELISSLTVDAYPGDDEYIPDFEEDSAPIAGVGMVNIASLLPLLADNSDALAELVEKYVALLITEIKANAQITEATDGSNTKTTYVVNADGLGMIVANVLDAFFTDTNAIDLLTKLGVDIDSILASKPSKAELQQTYKELFAEELGNPVLTASITTDADKAIVAIDVDMVMNQATVLTLDYDKAAGTFSLVSDEDPTDNNKTTIDAKVENDTLTATYKDVASYGDGIVYTNTINLIASETGFSFTSKNEDTDGYTASEALVIAFTDNSASFSYTNAAKNTNPEYPYEYEDGVSAELTWSDTGFTLELTDTEDTDIIVAVSDKDGKVDGKLTIDGEEMGSIIFDKAVDGNKTTYTLKSLKYDAVSIDFSDVGLSFIFETGVTVPDAPATYESLAEMTEEDMQTLLMDIATKNQELLQKLGIAGDAVEDAA